ncbi:MAG: UDP-N-acetylmuramoyl-tripeptide--D-alanyl-D-alanine ligase [Rhodospirillaceae bacterium]
MMISPNPPIAANDRPLWTADQAASALASESQLQRPLPDGTRWAATGVCIDSRTLAPGDLFVAIVGERFDGHDFVATALTEGGAAAALVSQDPAVAWPDLDPARFLVVEDTLEGLASLARFARARFTGKLLGITGSVGKTSTKEMAARMLRAFGTVHATQGNLNNHIGVPLTLARLPANADFAVIEMGMNHPGEIAPLTHLSRPHAALVTTVTEAHLENFDSIDGIAEEKADIFLGLDGGGAAIVNLDIAHTERLKVRAADVGALVAGFGHAKGSHGRLENCTTTQDQTDVTASIGGKPLQYSIGTPGAHWAMNSLAVLCALSVFGLDPEIGARTLADLRPPKGRGARQEVSMAGGTLSIIDETYNASPESVRAAVNTLALAQTGPGGRRIAVLGDMLELGPSGPALHAGLAAVLMEHNIDLVFTAGPLSAHLHQALPQKLRAGHSPESLSLAPLVREAVRPGDVVMIKGSNGSRMGVIVQSLIALETGAQDASVSSASAPSSPQPR